ncbi:MAG: polyprenyl synthetase family protein [Thermodesulfobacteriota bacterium]
MSGNIENYINNKKKLIDTTLSELYPTTENKKSKLSESIRYSLLAGGKRLRSVLCLASCETFNDDYSKALPVACAIEMIHTYSLIHDDLPSMDDDDLRRGVPTNHKIYGEATAILAGDALITDAFNIIIENSRKYGVHGDTLLDVICYISYAAGSQGMIKGQSIDLEIEGNTKITAEELKYLHSLKTGALIEASVISGAVLGGAENTDVECLRDYSKNIGLAYQIIDDVIDDDGDSRIGKTKGSDLQKNKPTFKTLLGDSDSRNLIRELTNKAVLSLKNIGKETNLLKDLAEYLGQRNY